MMRSPTIRQTRDACMLWDIARRDRRDMVPVLAAILIFAIVLVASAIAGPDFTVVGAAHAF